MNDSTEKLEYPKQNMQKEREQIKRGVGLA